LTPRAHLSYPETLAQSCVCASAGILKQHAVPGVPQASGSEMVALPAHSTRSSLPVFCRLRIYGMQVALRTAFGAAIGLGLDSSWVIDLEVVRSVALSRLPPVRD
jgi:hypothetical protein